MADKYFSASQNTGPMVWQSNTSQAASLLMQEVIPLLGQLTEPQKASLAKHATYVVSQGTLGDAAELMDNFRNNVSYTFSATDRIAADYNIVVKSNPGQLNHQNSRDAYENTFRTHIVAPVR